MIEKNTKNILLHEESPYTILINDVINNIRHTGALGIYSYLASKPSGWEICKKHLQNHFDCGTEHINTCFKYLKNIGAIEVMMIRDEKGRCIEWKTVLKRKLSHPANENIQNTENPESGAVSRIRVSQNVGFPESGKSAPINTRYIQIQDNIKNIGTSCEVQNIDYSEFDDINEKPDFHSNQAEVPKSDAQVTELKENIDKSDYCENQRINYTDRKLRQQYGLKDILSENIFQIPTEMLQDWITNRKKKKVPVTRTAWTKINKELAKCEEQGTNPIEAFETMVASGWQSLKVEYFANHQSLPNKPRINNMDTSWSADVFKPFHEIGI